MGMYPYLPVSEHSLQSFSSSFVKMRPLESILLVVILFSAILCISADPEPDTSDQCQACQERVMQLNDIWTNATELVNY